MAPVLTVLCLVTLGRQRQSWPALGQAVGLAGLGALVSVSLLAVRGPTTWRLPPLGSDVMAVSLVVGAAVYLVARRFGRTARTAPAGE